MIKRILAAAALTMAVTSISSGAMAATGEGTGAATKGGGDAREGVVAAAVSPSVSPAAEAVVYRATGVREYDCPSGRLCVDVWDPTRGTYKVFQFYRCQTHSLSAFYSTNTPEFENNQTSGTNTYFERSWGDRYLRSTAKHGERSISWDPINFIDVC
ncbi:hypothetical protein OG984_25670 [Nocardioides sp. NBC_00368]|uniref:hypothetical protein n=1 Tax=Nocardioides sp. NBC_00368 TaxID=2976000 RepID=UPI002E22D1C3